MSSHVKGKVIPLSPARRLVHELMHHAKKVPSLPLSRTFLIPDLVDLRTSISNPPSWFAVFMKAYGIVAQQIPELRHAFLPYPYARLYEHPTTTCTVLVEREFQGEPIVLAAKIRAPENSSLLAIDQHLRSFREKPLAEISEFRQLLRLGRVPGFCRRFVFWSSLYWSGAKRAKRLGTCMMSSLGALGVEQEHPLTPLSTYFTFGPVRTDGEVTAKIIYDHRVMDGRTIARALVALEEVLKTAVYRELMQCKAPALKLAFAEESPTRENWHIGAAR